VDTYDYTKAKVMFPVPQKGGEKSPPLGHNKFTEKKNVFSINDGYYPSKDFYISPTVLMLPGGKGVLRRKETSGREAPIRS